MSDGITEINMSKIELIKGAAGINKAIDSIKNRGAKLDASIQLAGLSVLAHASEHGDTTCADRLVMAMPKGARKLALVEWMLAYGQVRKLDPKDAEDKLRINAGGVFQLDRSRTLDMASAMDKQWHEFKPEAAITTAFDAQAAVQSVIKRLQTAAASGLSVTHRAEALKAAQELCDALAGDSVAGDHDAQA